MCMYDTIPRLFYPCFPPHRAPSTTNPPSQRSALSCCWTQSYPRLHTKQGWGQNSNIPPPALKLLFLWNESTYVVFPWCLHLTSWFSFSACPLLWRRCRRRCHRPGQGWGQWQSGCKSVRETRELSTCSATTDLQLKPSTALQRSPGNIL